ncbi:hypothetical protein L7750_14840 [Xenorhabdus bovienii]|uniref:Uncharacterized protein n=3 Tax=Xenorhabdus TaxID=626 RepID=A0A077PIW3_XENBV|nr:MULTISPECIES: hypothetical protein [Xenorhabdus]MCG3471626.1 hypothetical protein [Xenorhabdus bovienii]MDC9588960.1 hypothetical protein [Xenorhabdus yunnanensis]CDH02789.1 exported hypothetical protein [Xenorhabdus bovienii str. feltiae Moldova]CDH24335.1 exported hypothetical protein [Xenorhabdus bovienii str. kraussei Becker Underwood]
MRNNSTPFTSAICWISFWLGTVLVGASWLYAKLQGKEFLVGLSEGLMNITSPDSTVAIMLSIGAMMIAIGMLYVPLFYTTVFVQAFMKVLTRKPIRI